MALQDLKNDIKAGKKIFELFEKAEIAIDELLQKEGTSADLEATIKKRKTELDALDTEVEQAHELLREARDEAKFATNKAKEDAEGIVKTAKQKAEDIVAEATEKALKAKNEAARIEDDIASKKLDLKAVNDDLVEAQDRLDALNAQIDKTRAEFKNAIGA